MFSGIGIQESVAVRPAHPVPSIYGRGGFLIDEERKRRSRPEQAGGSSAAPDATDATGLSLRPDEVAASLDRLRADQTVAHERAYVAAGRRGQGRVPDHGPDRPDYGADANSASLVTASPSGSADAAAREAGAPDLRAAGDQSRRDRADPGQDAFSPEETAGGAEARSAERTFLGSGSGGESPGDARPDPNRELTEEEKHTIQELKARDREVHTHEQAHLAASNGLSVGGATFQHERGPDGRMYAVAGEVNIDTSEGENPDDTIAKARRIRAAAMAPARPSGQDLQVAAQAAQMETSARLDKSSGDGAETSAAGGTRARNNPSPTLLQRAAQAYARASDSAFPAPWGSGTSLAV